MVVVFTLDGAILSRVIRHGWDFIIQVFFSMFYSANFLSLLAEFTIAGAILSQDVYYDWDNILHVYLLFI